MAILNTLHIGPKNGLFVHGYKAKKWFGNKLELREVDREWALVINHQNSLSLTI